MSLRYGIHRFANLLKALGVFTMLFATFAEYAYIIFTEEGPQQGRPLTVGVIWLVTLWVIGLIIDKFGAGETRATRAIRFFGAICLVFGLGSQAHHVAGYYLYVGKEKLIEFQEYERYGAGGALYGIFAFLASLGIAYVIDGFLSKRID